MIDRWLAGYQARVRTALDNALPAATLNPQRLHEAMRYAVLDGGKRLRPTLVYLAAETLGAPADHLDDPACAVELIHCYSLVHDDLPGMDDDDLRRGRPTCHRAYDEPTAMLVGDALQSLAFRLLATSGAATPAQRLAMVETLATAAGSRGMAGGQAMDLAAVGRELNEAELEAVHIHKTGALIRASVRLGALCADGADTGSLERLDHFAKCIGLAFQVQDDVLDITGDSTVTGKARGGDERLNKPTYPGLLGLDEARRFARQLCEDAVESLAPFDARAERLRELARYIVARDH